MRSSWPLQPLESVPSQAVLILPDCRRPIAESLATCTRGRIPQRHCMMAKNRSGFVVAYGPSENVPVALTGTFAKLKAELDLHGLDDEAIAARLAYFYSELDAIHAFREGNSRTLRAITSDLAQLAGHRLDWA